MTYYYYNDNQDDPYTEQSLTIALNLFIWSHQSVLCSKLYGELLSKLSILNQSFNLDRLRNL